MLTKRLPIDLASYLDWEDEQPGRHEWVQGRVRALVDDRRVENLVKGNLAVALKVQLRGHPARAFMHSAKVQTPDDAILYPDVFVTCDAADLRTEQIFTAPTLVVEVLSPSTQAYDRGLKFTLYRRLASLREYLLVDPDTRELQLFRRGADGLFTLHDLTGAAQVEFVSLGVTLAADEIFDGLDEAPAA